MLGSVGGFLESQNSGKVQWLQVEGFSVFLGESPHEIVVFGVFVGRENHSIVNALKKQLFQVVYLLHGIHWKCLGEVVVFERLIVPNLNPNPSDLLQKKYLRSNHKGNKNDSSPVFESQKEGCGQKHFLNVNETSDDEFFFHFGCKHNVLAIRGNLVHSWVV